MNYQDKIDMMSKYLQHGPPYKYKEIDHVYLRLLEKNAKKSRFSRLIKDAIEGYRPSMEILCAATKNAYFAGNKEDYIEGCRRLTCLMESIDLSTRGIYHIEYNPRKDEFELIINSHAELISSMVDDDGFIQIQAKENPKEALTETVRNLFNIISGILNVEFDCNWKITTN